MPDADADKLALMVSADLLAKAEAAAAAKAAAAAAAANAAAAVGAPSAAPAEEQTGFLGGIMDSIGSLFTAASTPSESEM